MVMLTGRLLSFRLAFNALFMMSRRIISEAK